MVFEDVKSYIVNSGIVPKATHKDFPTTTYDAIYYLGKPEEHKAESYLVYSYRFNGGGIVKKYSFEITVCSVDPVTVEDLKNKVVNLIDFYNRPVDIPHFVKFALSGEDGTKYESNTGMYVDTLRFDCNYL